MAAKTIYLWQRVPSLRLLLPLIVGIIVQTYAPLTLNFIVAVGLLSIFFIITYSFFSDAWKFKLAPANGLALQLAVLMLGACLTYKNDIRNHPLWFGKQYRAGNYLLVNLLEPLVEKKKTYKALGQVQSVIADGKVVPANGHILIYFRKDSSLPPLTIGSQLLVNRPLEDVRNSGNPGSFNYKQYLLFKGITHQLNLLPHEFVVQGTKVPDLVRSKIFSIRKTVVRTLRKYIGSGRESGFAEALLIGYKDDLDKNLVQSYSNTGVVHIIAISGLHLGLIYGILVWLTKAFRKRRSLQWLRFSIITIGLWAFAFVAGGHPSVLRSAVMFSCIAVSGLIFRRSHVINTLAFSAFLLLCFNPFWLWDVGFQLSYSAVLSILVFYQPIYNAIYVKNKLLNFVWQLSAVSLAAQVLTSPISIYHFHQFPLLFLPANLVAVPLAGVILTSEMILLLVSPFEQLGNFLGFLLQTIISLLNNYIEYLDKWPFAVWNQLSIDIYQLFFLFGFIIAAAFFLLQKHKGSAWAASVFLLFFMVSRTASFIRAQQQAKIIVYNTPGLRAIDLIVGRKHIFIGDSVLRLDGVLRNFHLQPSRVLHRTRALPMHANSPRSFMLNRRKVLLIDSTFSTLAGKPHFDVVIFSGKSKIGMQDLQTKCTFRQIVLDGAVPFKQRNRLRQDCDSLGVLCHDVSKDGAFVMNVL